MEVPEFLDDLSQGDTVGIITTKLKDPYLEQSLACT